MQTFYSCRCSSVVFLRPLFAPALVLVIALTSVGAADTVAQAGDSATNKSDLSSSNFKKSGERFLPGEEVVTPTGRKLKVWSSEGPVKVNPAPEPFCTGGDKSSECGQAKELQPTLGGVVVDTRRIERGKGK